MTTSEMHASPNAKLALATQRRADAAKALDELRALKEAEAQKTVRLRALRLAREAAQQEAAPAAKPATAKPKKRIARS